MSLDLNGATPAALPCFHPSALARTLSKSAIILADMNRNTTHHAVALTELSQCFDKQFRINYNRLYRKRLWTFTQRMGVYPGSTASACSPERDFSLDRKPHLSVSFRVRICARTIILPSWTYARSKSVFMTLLSAATRTLCGIFIEQVFTPGSASTSSAAGSAYNRLWQWAWLYVCLLSPARQPPIWHSPEPCSAVSASAPFLYAAICCLVSENDTASLPPTKSSLLCCSASQSQTAWSLSSKLPAGLLFILTAMSTLRTPRAPAAISSFSTIFGSVGFLHAVRFFLVAQRTVNAIHQGHYVASSLLLLRRQVSAKCFLVIWYSASSRLTPTSSRFALPPKPISYTVHSTSIFSSQTSYMQFVHVWIGSFAQQVRILMMPNCTCYICRTVVFLKIEPALLILSLGRCLLIRPCKSELPRLK